MMFAIQYYRMFVRAIDDCMTSNKASARLFDTAEEAETWLTTVWLPDCQVSLPINREPIYIVEVETKPIIHKVLKTVKQF
jgi:hypothetical protein